MTADERATALEAAALAAAAVRVQRRRLTTPTILMPGLRPLRPTLDVDAWRARAAALVVRDAL